MRLEVFDESKDEKQVVRLQLRSRGDTIDLVAVDEAGNVVSQGYLMVFHPNGTFSRETSVSPLLGFQLEPDNQIIKEKD